MITHTGLLDIIAYNPETGQFTWTAPRQKIRVGAVAGWRCKKGRNWVEIFGKQYACARLAIFYMTGKWPPEQVDHINLDKGDDRWKNLRCATQSQNQGNRASKKGKKIPFKGVTYKSHLPKPYIAQICKDKTHYHLGCFSTPQEAHEAYCTAAKRLHGEFWRG